MTTFIKDPDATLNYTVDWSKYLGTTDTISTSTWIVPAGLTQNTVSQSTTTATIFLSSGTLDVSYEVTNRINTVAGIIDDRSFVIKIGEK